MAHAEIGQRIRDVSCDLYHGCSKEIVLTAGMDLCKLAIQFFVPLVMINADITIIASIFRTTKIEISWATVSEMTAGK